MENWQFSSLNIQIIIIFSKNKKFITILHLEVFIFTVKIAL